MGNRLKASVEYKVAPFTDMPSSLAPKPEIVLPCSCNDQRQSISAAWCVHQLGNTTSSLGTRTCKAFMAYYHSNGVSQHGAALSYRPTLNSVSFLRLCR